MDMKINEWHTPHIQIMSTFTLALLHPPVFKCYNSMVIRVNFMSLTFTHWNVSNTCNAISKHNRLNVIVFELSQDLFCQLLMDKIFNRNRIKSSVTLAVYSKLQSFAYGISSLSLSLAGTRKMTTKFSAFVSRTKSRLKHNTSVKLEYSLNKYSKTCICVCIWWLHLTRLVVLQVQDISNGWATEQGDRNILNECVRESDFSYLNQL